MIAGMRKMLLSSMKTGSKLALNLDKLGVNFTKEGDDSYVTDNWPADVIFDAPKWLETHDSHITAESERVDAAG